MVAYLYDELNPAERTSFEAHLAYCGICTDEFAELSFARLDVYEWHRDEFADMATPRFVIPYTETQASASWLAGFRGFFASNRQWATAGGVFALIAVIFAALMISTMTKETGEVAQTPVLEEYTANKIQSVDPPARPSAELMNIPPASPRDIGPNDPQIVKTVTIGKSSKSAITANRRTVKTPERNLSQPLLSRRSSVPRLNDFEDEEDNTLRLGDLLADVDTGK